MLKETFTHYSGIILNSRPIWFRIGLFSSSLPVIGKLYVFPWQVNREEMNNSTRQLTVTHLGEYKHPGRTKREAHSLCGCSCSLLLTSKKSSLGFNPLTSTRSRQAVCSKICLPSCGDHWVLLNGSCCASGKTWLKQFFSHLQHFDVVHGWHQWNCNVVKGCNYTTWNSKSYGEKLHMETQER